MDRGAFDFTEKRLTCTFCFAFSSHPVYRAADSTFSMALPPAQRRSWTFSADPHHYHWETLFVKGKDMWHGAAARPGAIRALITVRTCDRVLCSRSEPDRS